MSALAVNRGLTALLLALLMVAPWLLAWMESEFWLTVLTEILIWGLFAASANLLFGQVGLLSFGQALYFGFGMYGVAIGIDRFGLGLWPAMGLGVAAAIVMAACAGVVAVRLTWHYFAIITVVFSLIFYFLALRLKPITGGDDGLSFAAPAIMDLGGLRLSLTDDATQYWFVLLIVALAFAVQARLRSSALGRAFAAVREGERKAALLGIDVLRVRWIAFVIAGGLAGLAGALFALYGRYASATHMYYTVSGEAVVWTVLGGAGTLLGPPIGAALLILVREELSGIWEHYPLIVGALTIAVVVFAPKGIAGGWNALLARVTGR
ncbi:branched-chain amino acid ABC transporter permease [Roseomonas hellenica]|uniref:Branched-chain amino acid ABC transporter permease n=1 Tax=Plastoroseomonas hellenica TaxID=2687306 RepID=A0ABS5ESA4_9PROT|nr:branched-chain amino acid ABC transporter permease [Plastoroseomonas hellenica]MBR0663168.1 branched-chain amino acid ABC transporter permease [Plastoroseomonas hellenica]